MKAIIFLKGCVAAVSVLVATALLAQTTPPPDRKTQSKIRLHEALDSILGVSGQKMAEARVLLRLKRFADAEAVCHEAIEVLAQAPFTQKVPKALLGEIWVTAGRYQEADELFLGIWPDGPSGTPHHLFWALAQAKTGQLEKGIETVLYPKKPVAGMAWAHVQGLPIADAPTAENLEATARMLIVRYRSTGPEEDYPELEQHLRLAISLASSNAVIHYDLATFVDRRKKSFEDAIPIYRKAHELGDAALKQRIEDRFRVRQVPF